jgi:GBP family porin
MKKSLIALAVLGAFSAGAAAQSSVTLYGIVDIGLQYNKFGVNRGTAAAPNFQQEAVWGVESGYQSGSRLGVRGSEAIGNGLNVVYTLEAGFDVSTGVSGQGGRLFGRQAWGGFQGNWGTVVLGRIATPSSGTGSFDMFGQIDPFSTGWGQAGLQATFIPSNSLREDNSVLYQSPTFGGFKFAAQYSFNVNLAETAPQGSNTTAYNLSGSWGWGPVYVAATYDVLQFPDPGFGVLGGNPDQKMLQLGMTWDFKIVKLAAAYADQKKISIAAAFNTTNNLGGVGTFVPVGVGNYNNSAYMLGVTIPLFGGKILGSYQKSDADNIDTPAFQWEPDYSNWAVGYEYPLSRRTNLYFGYAQRAWDGNIRLTPGGGILANAAQQFDRDQFAIGIRHLF